MTSANVSLSRTCHVDEVEHGQNASQQKTGQPMTPSMDLLGTTLESGQGRREDEACSTRHARRPQTHTHSKAVRLSGIARPLPTSVRRSVTLSTL